VAEPLSEPSDGVLGLRHRAEQLGLAMGVCDVVPGGEPVDHGCEVFICGMTSPIVRITGAGRLPTVIFRPTSPVATVATSRMLSGRSQPMSTRSPGRMFASTARTR
jgi:hypothetical protein